MKMTSLALGLAALCLVNSANAAFDLQISQIFPGGPDDNHLTADWFEVTNDGDMTWDSAVDGGLWYDDSSSDVSEAVQLVGVSSIPAGGSAVFVDIDDATATYDPLAEFLTFWNPALVGSYDNGAGLGGGGDAVTLYLAPPSAVSIDDLIQLDREAYTDTGVLAPIPTGNGAGDSAWSVALGDFHVAGASGAVLNSTGNRSAVAALPAIPEPTSLALASMTILALARRRR